MPIEYKQGGFANQSAELPQVAPNVRAFMKDSLSSRSKVPLTAGYFRLEKDKKQSIVYEFDEVKCFIEGECTISDEVGTKVTVHAGDIVLFNNGTTATFQCESDSSALAFYCVQRSRM
ncbi:unnamed protein product [Clonostachys rhizophaga]|uniref:(S)-ureidoglycine aminohydrolase cupin domain-containing protein n=1 Tax=Clonostachys rhizophaga TaxID=160324 RepID=A0A9N9VW37_9HYPO|nr:unnamed protein product [Clonostachys rhizophaga]